MTALGDGWAEAEPTSSAQLSASSGAGRPPTAVPDVADLVRVVALDGPAGSGKSSVARGAAAALGWRFVDTGASYRAVTLAVLRAGVSPEDPAGVAAVATAADVQLVTDPAAPRVLLEGEDVSKEVRSAAVTEAVSAVSAVPEVRAHLIELQRRAMGVTGAVVEGRDIATVVAPQAGVKVYLDADPAVRARRRAHELAGSRAGGLPAGSPGDRALSDSATQPGPASAAWESQVRDALQRRDARDDQTNRLEVSDGAVHLDTTKLTLEQVIDAVVQLVRRAGLVDSTVPGSEGQA